MKGLPESAVSRILMSASKIPAAMEELATIAEAVISASV